MQQPTAMIAQKRALPLGTAWRQRKTFDQSSPGANSSQVSETVRHPITGYNKGNSSDPKHTALARAERSSRLPSH